MRELVTETLKLIGCYSEDAVNLLLGVIAQESSMGKYRKQIGGGPALGIVQMETSTFNDIVNNFLIYHKDLAKKILECANVEKFEANDLINNDRLAIAMARMQFYRRPTPIPHRLEDQAAMWKRYYNTPLGAGTVEEYIKNYHRYVLNS